MAEMALLVAGTAISAMGTLAQGNAAAQQGKIAQQGLEYQARQLEVNAGQERAASQRDAIEARRSSQLSASRAINLSGAGASDPTITGIVGGIGAEGEYNALSALYEGEERARGLKTQADVARYEGRTKAWEGKVAKQQSRVKAIGQVLSASSSGMSGKYGGDGFKSMMADYDMYDTLSGRYGV